MQTKDTKMLSRQIYSPDQWHQVVPGAIWTLITHTAGLGKVIYTVSDSIPDPFDKLTPVAQETEIKESQVFTNVATNQSIYLWPIDISADLTIDKSELLSQSNLSMDYIAAVRAGKIPGHTLDTVTCRNPVVGDNYEDCWGGGGFIDIPTSPEVYELVCDSPDDTDGGAGAWSVLIQSLDANGIEQFTPVTTNGGVASVPGTHLRPRLSAVLTKGTAESNVGPITIRVAGGGSVRNFIDADAGISRDGYYVMPSNKNGQVLTTWVIFPRSKDGQYRNRVRTGSGDEAWISPAEINIDENFTPFYFQSNLAFPANTELRIQVRARTGTADITVIFEVLLIEEGY